MSVGQKVQDLAPQSVLVITDDVSFRSKVVEAWQPEPSPPLVICLSSDMIPNAQLAWCDVVVLGPVQPETLGDVLVAAGGAPAAVAFLPWGVSLSQVHAANPNILPLHCSDDAAELAVSIGQVLLRRVAVERQLNVKESAAKESNVQAILGQFMVESRHSFNNALTSVLGTAELLLLLDAARLAPEQRDQIKTVHAMAMRLYQMMARFSALEAELKLSASRGQDWAVHHHPIARPEIQQ